MVILKACKHYKHLYKDETIIIQGKLIPWDAWIEAFKKDKLIYISYEKGLFSRYLHHLKSHKECRKEINISLTRVKLLIWELEKDRGNLLIYIH